jgi:hypothetical protein
VSGDFFLGLLAATLLLGVVILVHKVILVAKIVLIDGDVAQGMGDSLLRGGLEVGQEVLERGCSAVNNNNLEIKELESVCYSLSCTS